MDYFGNNDLYQRYLLSDQHFIFVLKTRRLENFRVASPKQIVLQQYCSIHNRQAVKVRHATEVAKLVRLSRQLTPSLAVSIPVDSIMHAF